MTGSTRACGVMAAAFVTAWFCIAVPVSRAAGDCADCKRWNQPHKPFRIYGNTWYVGTQGLSAILITSEYGHVLIDGGLEESAPLIKANIEALGFKLADVKAILNSHAHFDHAGGIAALEQQSGAPVYAMRPGNEVLETGKLGKEDPQYGLRPRAMTPVQHVWVVQDDQLLGVGAVRLRALATPGHTPGGTSWSWESCQDSICLQMVYADSLSAVGANNYRFSTHPEVLRQFAQSFARLEGVSCDVLMTPHPDASKLFERLDRGSENKAADVKQAGACRDYVAQARAALGELVASGK